MTDPIKAFVENCIKIEIGHIEIKYDVYKAYIEYCVKNNLRASIAKNTFSKILPEYIPSIVETRTTRLGKQVRAWQNIRLQQDKNDISVKM
jgi:phage/plasmid-associated DNA primase